MLLEVLIDNGMCPLTKDELTAWVKEDIYPTDQRFRDWFKVQPYELRAAALERALTPYELGRGLYHMDQRRGFRSNRKEGDGEQKKFNSGDEDRGIRGYGETQELLREHGTMGRVAVHLSKQRKVEAVRVQADAQPLHPAATSGHASIVELLLASGADPNAEQSGQWSALHGAAEKGHAEVVALLLRHGAESGRRSSSAATALSLATERRHEAVVRLLAPATGPG